MAVSSTTAGLAFTGNASTATAYSLAGLRYDSSAWLVVTTVDAAGTVTTLTEGTHFTLGGDGSAGTGTLTSTSGNAIPATSTLRVDRATPATQTTELENDVPLDHDALETALDKLTLQHQDQGRTVAANLARSLRVPDGDTAATLSSAALRAGTVVYFNASTGAVEHKTPSQILALSGGAPDGIGIPAGGTTGQALRKSSAADYAVEWESLGILQGSGAPATSTGYNGDGYFDIATGTFYQKAADAWSATVTLPRFYGPLDYYPTGNPGDTLIHTDFPFIIQFRTPETWLPQGATVSTAATTYIAAVESNGNVPEAEEWAAFQQRLHRAFWELEQAGILDELIDGAYYGSDGQVTTGAPLAFSGTAAGTNTGTYTRTALGLSITETTDEIRHVTAGTQDGTIVVDTYQDFTTAADALLLEVCNTDRLNRVQMYGLSGARSSIAARNSGFTTQSADTANSGTARYNWSRNRERQTVGVNFGTTACECFINGIDSTPASAPTYSTATDLTDVRIATTKGRRHSWLYFDRRLTAAEHDAAVRALAILDRRRINLLIEGDSTSEAIFSLTRSRDHWADKILDETGFDSAVRIACNNATSGHAVSAMITQWATQGPQNIIPGKRNILVLWGGINDDPAANTAATVYGRLTTLAATARAAGCEVCIPTIAVPDTGGTDDAAFADLNTLIRAGEGTDYDIGVDVDAAIPSHDGDSSELWYDSAHLNGDGNAIVAALIAEAIL